MNGETREAMQARIRQEALLALAWHDQGWNYSQIGGRLGLSMGSVRLRLRQARLERAARERGMRQ